MRNKPVEIRKVINCITSKMKSTKDENCHTNRHANFDNLKTFIKNLAYIYSRTLKTPVTYRLYGEQSSL